MDCFPKNGKNRPQKPSDDQFPDKTAQKHGDAVGDPDICLTEPEMEKQPAVEQKYEEKKVGKVCVLRPQRAQKAVSKPEGHAGQDGIKKALRGKLRRCHRIRRLNQPPAERGSS